ncbi:MAG TPA: adenylate/guanylate cyclase domain-containing protein [Xanthobacteraceae bacterium]|jgi:adenylate cyclase|nr:adenylate/guanylate cyclase domain-containing protein [Xanthobacteraceae bacterium]
MAEERIVRRLAAILAADVAGYSRMMGADEEGTLAALKAIRREIIEPKIAEHQGRIVKTTGDGALVEFGSAVDAVRCALDVQRATAERNVAIPEDRRIAFRIGINVGDIISDEGDIYGDGVNIAARIEPLAEPGAICLSDNAYQQIKGKLSLDITDMGERELKNIAQPVRVYGIRPGGAARPSLSLPDRPSIAVLPFQNMSGDAEQDYFVDGMVEDIITGLSRIKWLFVIARNSTFAYKGRAVDVKQVGRELGVRYVLEGSVRKAADRVRITGQLIDTATGAHVWAERYDRKFDDIFALQDEITLSVVGAIEPSLRLAEIERVKRKRSDSLDAYDLVLQTQADVYSRIPERATKALLLLERALAFDANYALAHAYAAECYHTLFLRGGLREENRTASIRHAEAAMANGADDASALAFAGFVIGMDKHDHAAAFTAFEAALSVSPSSALTYFLGSVILAFSGDAERAIEWADRGLRLSPLDPHRSPAFVSCAFGHFHRGRYEEAAAAGRKAIQSSPGFSVSYLALAAPLVKLGRLEEAKAAAARVLELQPTFRCSRNFAASGCVPPLAAALTEALVAAGLPD